MGVGTRRDEEFGALVAAQSAPLLYYARLLTRDPQLAEDLVQEALIRVYLRWGAIREDPVAYTRRTVLNQFLSGRRRRRVVEVSLGDVEPGAAATEMPSVIVGLGALTDKERAVVVLRYHLDLSEQQTADMLNVAVGTVKSTSHRALGKLRKVLVQAEQE